VRGSLVPLHGSSAGERTYFLYAHLARLLAPAGVAVLRYDRRPADGDVPFATQAVDAMAAVHELRARTGGAPVGLWGYSQGGWVAALAAAEHPDEVAFVVAVSASGVSPAAQMRYGTAEQLRRRGYSDGDLRELAALRAAAEAYLRGDLDRDAAQAVVDRAADRPWFPLAWVPRRLPAPGSWADMDFDPAPVLARLRRPALAFYGETDEWTPIEESAAAWARAAATVVRLPGCDHLPTDGGVPDPERISGAYADTLLAWITDRLGTPA
jgi:pimeloyl-ACP methyl ester carboxylesterase